MSVTVNTKDLEVEVRDLPGKGCFFAISKFFKSSPARKNFEGELGDLIELVRECVKWPANVHPGYRDGVVEVEVPPAGFWCPIVQLKGYTPVGATFNYRSPPPAYLEHEEQFPEEARLAIVAPGKGTPASAARVILYSSICLAEDNDHSFVPEKGNWEIVHLVCDGPWGKTPIHPTTLLYNHFADDIGPRSGGTRTMWDAGRFEEELCRSFLFWRDKALVDAGCLDTYVLTRHGEPDIKAVVPNGDIGTARTMFDNMVDNGGRWRLECWRGQQVVEIWEEGKESD